MVNQSSIQNTRTASGSGPIHTAVLAAVGVLGIAIAVSCALSVNYAISAIRKHRVHPTA